MPGWSFVRSLLKPMHPFAAGFERQRQRKRSISPAAEEDFLRIAEWHISEPAPLGSYTAGRGVCSVSRPHYSGYSAAISWCLLHNASFVPLAGKYLVGPVAFAKYSTPIYNVLLRHFRRLARTLALSPPIQGCG